MVKAIKSIKWDKQAAISFGAAISYIRTDSVKSAEKARKDVLAKIKGLKEHPEKYPLDKLKKADGKIYRAFELHHYRICYMVSDSDIIITQIRHTSMDPLTY